MWARSLVMTAAMTRSAAPLAKSAFAICSIIRPVVRSDMPMATVPLPMISTSPPSSDAWPKSSSPEPVVLAELRIPVLEGLVLEPRMGAVDRRHVVGLAPAGGPVHGVDRDAAIDPARRVAREQQFGKRRQDEGGVVVDGRRDERGSLAQLPEVEARLGDGQAADQVARQGIGRQARSGSAWTSSTRLGPTTASEATRSMSRRRTCLVAGGERLAQQVLDVQHLDAALAHARDELVVLPLGPFDPQDVVEQELVVIGRASAA